MFDAADDVAFMQVGKERLRLLLILIGESLASRGIYPVLWGGWRLSAVVAQSAPYIGDCLVS